MFQQQLGVVAYPRVAGSSARQAALFDLGTVGKGSDGDDLGVVQLRQRLGGGARAAGIASARGGRTREASVGALARKTLRGMTAEGGERERAGGARDDGNASEQGHAKTFCAG